mmetsp:Transcript_22097/g.33395  ORF Transcript_22097/g.33395 Transcript_22097/m.33395 type:complete len:397 (+) Transcript_22097:231-1421(+)
MRSISKATCVTLLLCATCCSSFFGGRQRYHSLKNPSCPTRQRRRRRSFVALSSSLAGDTTNNNVPEQQIVRQKRMSNGYRVLTVTYTALAAFQKFFQQKPPSSSFVSAASMMWILSKAAHRNKLANDTHKRLNVVMSIYGIINVLQSCRRNPLTIVLVSVMTWILYKTALPTPPQPEEEIRTGIKKSNKFLFKNSSKNSILLSIYRILSCGVIQSYCGGWNSLLAIFTTLHCFRGYIFGVKGWILQEKTIFLLQNDLKQSWKQTQQTMMTFLGRNIQSLFYWLTTMALSTQWLWQLVVFIGMRDATPSDLLCKLWLMMGTSLTLKVGADRGSLMASTYIFFNFLLSYAFGTTTTEGFLCVIFGIMGWVVKRRKEKFHDNLLDNGAYRLSDDFPLQE